MTNASGTYFFQYTDENGVVQTVHRLPKGQLDGLISSLRVQGVDPDTMLVWEGTTLFISEQSDDTIIVGGEQIA